MHISCNPTIPSCSWRSYLQEQLVPVPQDCFDSLFMLQAACQNRSHPSRVCWSSGAAAIELCKYSRLLPSFLVQQQPVGTCCWGKEQLQPEAHPVSQPRSLELQPQSLEFTTRTGDSKDMQRPRPAKPVNFADQRNDQLQYQPPILP